MPIEAADLNGDGIINTNDYTIMRRYIMEIITEISSRDNKTNAYINYAYKNIP